MQQCARAISARRFSLDHFNFARGYDVSGSSTVNVHLTYSRRGW
jgi:hypothetical protein